ncbi:MAG: hypothetical protein LAN71_05630 [Acidobacteriia bacterium]|nr:hypothetical protein [Terriglobia bacterium]
MSTEQHNTGQDPVHKDVGFEAKDIQVPWILKFLVVMAVVLVASYYLCWAIYSVSLEHARRADVQAATARQAEPPKALPEPFLQGVPGHETDPQQDLRDMRARERKNLSQTRWVDEKAGIAEIPVEEAMKIISEKGLPVTAPAPAGKKK